MSGLNANYVAALDLNPYFVDKSTGTPLSGGTISFYEDNNRTTAKPVYELVQGGAIPLNYSYAPFSNPIILSGVGTVVDNNGNQAALYYFPYDEFGNVQLYYIECYDANGLLQFTREAWPFPFAGTGGGGGGPPGPTSNVTAIVNAINQANHGFVGGNVVYLVGGLYTLALATSIITAEAVGIVTTVIDADNFNLTSVGYCTGLSGFGAGTVYFLSDLSAGALTATETTTSGNISKPLFVADSASSGYFINFRGKILP